MKRLLSIFLSVILLAFMNACTENNEEIPTILPTNFTVDVPDAISFTSSSNGRKTETLDGSLVYANIGLFIHIAESSAHLVEEFIYHIRKHNINEAFELTYTSDEDNRLKKLVVTENATYAGSTWNYMLEITDVEAQKTAFQLVWNTNPVKGIALMNAYYTNQKHGIDLAETMYQIEYSEAEADVDQQMIVSVSGWPAKLLDKGGINNLKMKVTKKGSLVEISGNSNHPNLQLIDQSYTGGYNYAFVARADAAKEIGVAEVGLPPSDANFVDDLLLEFSVHSVLQGEIFAVYGTPEPGTAEAAFVESILNNTKAPGYFVHPEGFVSCFDQIPEGFSSEFINLTGLSPYMPNEITNLNLQFK